MIWIGTSGWVYPHWVGCFYPPDLPEQSWLAYYAQRFPTVEINRSFYRLPTRDQFGAWARQVAAYPTFLFAVKASRYLTHLKKLKDTGEGITRQLTSAEGLGERLGPLLYQLPPRWRANTARLAEFVARLPPSQRSAFEFRDPTWYGAEITRVLDAAGCARVIAIGGSQPTPGDTPPVGPFRYLRVHGGLYGVGLTDGELDYWAKRIQADADTGLDIYVYFNNDPGCHAIYDARRLYQRLAPSSQVAPASLS